VIVDQHQPVVEKYYGSGNMRSVVVRLLEECDRVTKTLKIGWEEDRSMQRKVRFFYHSMYLVAHHTSSQQLTETTNNPPNPLYSSNAPRKPVNVDDATVDPREIDKVLSEVAGMIGRWHLFKRFLADTVKACCSVIFRNLYSYHLSQEDQEYTQTNDSISRSPRTEDRLSNPDIVTNTASERLFEELLIKYYVPLEIWYTRTIIDKVICPRGIAPSLF